MSNTTLSTEGMTYTIQGVKVKFPCKPYPSQFSMMDKIIRGLEKHQNSLLESPTGSGKTLALLCSALAWQQKEKEKARKEAEEEKESPSECCCKSSRSPELDNTASPYFGHPTGVTPSAVTNVKADDTLHNAAALMDPTDDDDDDFKPSGKKIKNMGTPRSHIKISYETNSPSVSTEHSEMEEKEECSCQCSDKKTSKRKIPKIYFGTRTHKQIAQIAKELGQTAYKHTKMTILASREHTCIDPIVSTMPNKSEECSNKLENVGCRFYDRVRSQISHRNMQLNGMIEAWDLEDFKGFCTKKQCCPYYGSRTLKESADIIFCPYNYLMDPLIRESMEISLKDQIVIVDEAHNIEDSSRDSASFSVTQKDLREAAEDLQKLIDFHIKTSEHKLLQNFCRSINHVIDSHQSEIPSKQYESQSKVWQGMEMVALLKMASAAPEDIPSIIESLARVSEDDPNPKKKKVPTATLR